MPGHQFSSAFRKHHLSNTRKNMDGFEPYILVDMEVSGLAAPSSSLAGVNSGIQSCAITANWPSIWVIPRSDFRSSPQVRFERQYKEVEASGPFNRYLSIRQATSSFDAKIYFCGRGFRNSYGGLETTAEAITTWNRKRLPPAYTCLTTSILTKKKGDGDELLVTSRPTGFYLWEMKGDLKQDFQVKDSLLTGCGIIRILIACCQKKQQYIETVSNTIGSLSGLLKDRSAT